MEELKSPVWWAFYIISNAPSFASRLVTINEQNDPTRSCPGAHTRRHSLGARSPFAHPYFLFCPQIAHIRGLGQRRQMQLFLLVIFLTECALLLRRFPFVLSRGACLPLPRCPIPFSRWSCICNMLDAPGNPRICPLLVTVLWYRKVKWRLKLRFHLLIINDTPEDFPGAAESIIKNHSLKITCAFCYTVSTDIENFASQCHLVKNRICVKYLYWELTRNRHLKSARCWQSY